MKINMDITFKKHNFWKKHYYLWEYNNYVILINSQSYHANIEKYLNRYFCYYIYEKNNNWNVKDYVDSYEYKEYDILPTLKECKKASISKLENYYLN